jgi:hypothetical protein
MRLLYGPAAMTFLAGFGVGAVLALVYLTLDAARMLVTIG